MTLAFYIVLGCLAYLSIKLDEYFSLWLKPDVRKLDAAGKRGEGR